MSNTQHTTRSIARSLPWRAALHVAGMALVAALHGCATAPAADVVTQRAVADFNSCAKPEYPHDDLTAGHQGTVTLGFLVNTDGTVGDSKVTRSSGFTSLDEAARVAIAKCRFHPALAGDKPVQQWAPIQYVWTLS